MKELRKQCADSKCRKSQQKSKIALQVCNCNSIKTPPFGDDFCRYKLCDREVSTLLGEHHETHCYLCPAVPGTSETFVITEIEALRAAGHKVSVLTMELLKHTNEYDFDIFELKRERVLSTLKGLLHVRLKGVFNAYKAASSQKSIRNLYKPI